MQSLKGQEAVVMGGTSGIGLATAIKLAALGASVTVTGRNRTRGEEVIAQHPALNAAFVDATSAAALSEFFHTHGPIDHLVLCVSGSKGAGPFKDITAADLREGFDLKFFAQFQAAQAALPHLSPTGSITFVSAISARAANPGTSGLAAINGAIEAMIKPMARELKPLRINAVSPGVVETPWWDRLPNEVRGPLLERSAAATLVGRNGSPEELGDAIVFLVTNAFVTGTVLEVDGGMRLS